MKALTAGLFAVMAAANALTMPLWGRRGDRRGHASTLRLSAGLASLGFLGHAVAPSSLLLWPARLFLGGGSAGASTSVWALAAVATPVHRRGMVMGAVFASRTLALGLAAVGGGLAAEVLGIRGLFITASLGVGVLLGVSRVSARRHGDGQGQEKTERA